MKDSPSVSSWELQDEISSSVFQNNSAIPSKYTCDGENINPPLSFSDVPENAKSLVLIVDDPDTAMGTWVHWVLYDIDPSTKTIEENSSSENYMKGVTNFGNNGYGGPCPPSGTHRYFFKLYALDTVLDSMENPTKKDLEKSMQNHIISQTELVGLYKRG